MNAKMVAFNATAVAREHLGTLNPVICALKIEASVAATEDYRSEMGCS
jgi:hypothetical protein